MTIRHGLHLFTLAAMLIALPAPGQEELLDGRVVNEVWGIDFVAPGYEVWEDHPLRKRPNLAAAGAWVQDGCPIYLSLFATLVDSGTSATECREQYAGNPIPLEADSDVTNLAFEDAPVAWTRFDRNIEDGVVQSQLYGYRVRDESCFELHISAVGCEGFGGIAKPILDSLALKPKPGVNLETVLMGMYLDLDPNHWKVHYTLAGEHLHNTTVNAARVRAYYENALRLSEGDLSLHDLWIVHEGLGLAWLEEDDGDAAIPPLKKAVELARSNPSAVLELGESLYNLACAYSLTNDLESACATAGELMEGLSGRERRQKLKEMRKDHQLRALRGAKCIKGF